MLGRNQTTILNSRLNSWLSPTREVKPLNENKLPSFSSYRSIQSPSPRSEFMGQVRDSIINQIKHQNICLENKIKLREQNNHSRDTFQSNNQKQHLYSQSKSPSNEKVSIFKFDGLFDKSKKKFQEKFEKNKNKENDDSIQFSQLEEVFLKVREQFDEHNRKEKLWIWEKRQMMKKIDTLENKIKDLEQKTNWNGNEKNMNK